MEGLKEAILSICAFLDGGDYSKETIRIIEDAKRLLLSIDDSLIGGNTELRLFCIFFKDTALIYKF